MIILGIGLVLYVVFIILTWFNRPKKQSYRIVIAGDVNHRNESHTEMKDLSKLNFIFGKKRINPLDYEIFVVSGNSMNTANIYDRDVVFVQKLCEEDGLKIEGSPVLVFEIDKSKDKEDSKPKDSPVEFKLRKFISYVNGTDSFDNWFDELKEKRTELSENTELIKDKFNSCVDRYKERNHSFEKISFILSQTLDERNQISYSFHPMKFLYGKVEYIVNAKHI